MKGKLNCWEFKECGRELGGKNVEELGVCPAALAQPADGIHNGKAGGRCCWVTAGILLGAAQQFTDCYECGFYDLVRKEEGNAFNVVIVIMDKIKHKKRADRLPA